MNWISLWHFPTICLRANVFNTIDGPAAVFRGDSDKILTLEDIAHRRSFWTYFKTQRAHIGNRPYRQRQIYYLGGDDKSHQWNQKNILSPSKTRLSLYNTKKSLINHAKSALIPIFLPALKTTSRETPMLSWWVVARLETIHWRWPRLKLAISFLLPAYEQRAKNYWYDYDVFPGGEKEMIRSMLSGSLELLSPKHCWSARMVPAGWLSCHSTAIPSVRNLIREGKNRPDELGHADN